MIDSGSRIRISIGSRFEEIDLVDQVAEASFRHIGLDEDAAQKAGLAVREAVANGVLHGNRQRPGTRVKVEFDLGRTELVVEVCDEGDGFDPDAVPDPLAPENLLKPTGRGIFLMRQLMDDVGFRFNTGCGTVVTLRKRFVPVPADEQG